MEKGDKVQVKRTDEVGTIKWIGVSNAAPAQYEVELDSGVRMFWEYELEAIKET